MAREQPSLKAGIKSISYMRDMARRAAASPPEQAAFRCYDLNQRGSASRQMLVPLDVWRRCSREPLPEREGPCFVGFDLGGSTSMTAGAAYWPEVGRLQVWGHLETNLDCRRGARPTAWASDTKEWLRGASFAHGRAG